VPQFLPLSSFDSQELDCSDLQTPIVTALPNNIFLAVLKQRTVQWNAKAGSFEQIALYRSKQAARSFNKAVCMLKS